MAPIWTLGSALLALLSVASALSPDRRHANIPPRPSLPKVAAEKSVEGPVVSRNGTVLPPYTKVYEFDQLIDHNNPRLGKFKQRYWHTYEFYEEGGPIILTTPGEGNADGYDAYLTNRTINGQFAQALNGSTIVLEHRFYGFSNPYPDLTVKSLRVHTIQQAIDDLEYFAKNVHLPQPNGDQVAPGKAPWILVGGSYAGALTSFTMVNKPNLFQAGYSSSGVVESIVDYWGYFEPIRQNMPKNCSADVQAVIAHIDLAGVTRNTKEMNRIKTLFGLTALDHFDDVAGALRNNLWDWQSLSPTAGPNSQFFKFCDALEVKDGVSAGPNGWGLDHALQAWGKLWTDGGYLENLCDDVSIKECLGTYDPTIDYFTNTTIDNAGRSWTWIVCNEVGFFQDGAPLNRPSLVTRLVQPSSDERQCAYMFPEAFSTRNPPVPNVDKTNRAYHGWFVKEDRLFFANGQRDPWREATISADGTNFHSTPSQPIAMSDGFHCSDLSTRNAAADGTVLAVQQQALEAVSGWIASWKPGRH